MPGGGQPRKITVAIGPLGRDLLASLERAVPAGVGHPVAQTPLIDIHEGEDGLVLEADLPGATAETLVIQLESNVLHLHALSVPELEAGLRVLHQEYPVARVFQRSFILSHDLDLNRIEAEFPQGVLRLSLPRAERAQSRRIEIKSSKPRTEGGS